MNVCYLRVRLVGRQSLGIRPLEIVSKFTALAVGARGGCLGIFTLICLFSPLSLSLWETARYRLKHCFKGPLNLKQPISVYIMSE